MRPLGRAIGRLMRGLGIERDLNEAHAVSAWPAVAAAVLGPDGARTHAVRVEDGTLVVAVPSTHWAAEIRLRERSLIQALESRAPGAIRRIRAVPSRSDRRGAPPSPGDGS